ncbi:MAG: Fic family protein [Phycisphaerales bacterium]|nr:Fic family protein [Phycisphaerales bacterium]
MPRETGIYRTTTALGEAVRAFIPHPLPPSDPPLVIDGQVGQRLSEARVAMGRLRLAGAMVPDPGWFLYGFVRKEAVLSSQIEGTEATLRDVATFEATNNTDRPADVEAVCNYVDGLNHARAAISDSAGLPISTRLLCEVHGILMRGVRGEDALPGERRRSQNWVGGTRPGNASFVPPPHDEVAPALAALESWIHADDPLPPLVKAGLAHVQFETIHPFLDGNGRVGRMLIALLVERWGLLHEPLLYLSVAFKRRQKEYYARLAGVRAGGDWEGWTVFFLECVTDAAEDAVDVAARLFRIVNSDRSDLIDSGNATVNTIRLLESLPQHPVMTLPRAIELLGVAKPTAAKCIDDLGAAGVLRETTGKRRDRVYAYEAYLATLTGEAM